MRFRRVALTKRAKIKIGVWSAVAVMLILAFSFLPSIGLRYGVIEKLYDVGMLSVTLQKAKVGLLDGRIELDQLEARTEGGLRSAVGGFLLSFDWRPLLQKRVQVDRFSLSDVDIEINRLPDGSLSIAGLPLPKGSNDPQKDSEPAQPSRWNIDIDEIALTNSNLIYRDGSDTLVLRLRHLYLSGLHSAKPDQPARLELQGMLNDSHIAITSDFFPFSRNVNGHLDLRVEALALEPLLSIAKIAAIKKFEGILTGTANADFTLGNALAVALDANLSLDNLALNYEGNNNVAAKRLQFAGSITYAATAQQVDGVLSAKDLRIKRPDTEGAISDIRWNMTPLSFAIADNAGLGGAWHGGIALGDTRVQLGTDMYSAAAMIWNGAVTAQLGGAKDMPVLTAAGHAALTGTAVSLPDLQTSLQSFTLDLASLKLAAESKAGTPIAAEFGMVLAGLSAKMPGSEIQQNRLAWDGQATATIGSLPTARITGMLKTEGSTIKTPVLSLSVGGITLNAETLTLSTDENRNRDAAWNGRVEVTDTKLALPLLNASQANLYVAGRAYGRLSGPDAFAIAFDGETGTERIRVDFPALDLWVAQNSAKLTTKSRVTVEPGNPIPKIEQEGDLVVGGLAAGVLKGRTELAELKELAVSRFQLKADQQVALEAIRLVDLHMLRNQRRGSDPSTNYPWRFELGQLQITNLGLAADRMLTIEGIDLEKMTTRVTRVGNGLLGIADLPKSFGLNAPSDGKQQKEPPAPAAGKSSAPTSQVADTQPGVTDKASPKIKIGHIDMVGDSRLIFEDRTLRDPIRIEALPIVLHINDIDSTADDVASKARLEIGFGKFGSVQLNGSARPFGEKINFEFTGKVTGLDLPPFSSYVANAVGVNFETGALDAELSAAAKNGALSGQGKLKLANLYVDERDDGSSDIKAEIDVPIGTALDLLRDDDGNIDLEIPFGGDIHDPQFNLSSVISKAIGGALRGAAGNLLKVVFPPALLISVIADGSHASVGIKPLEFPPGGAGIIPAHVDQLSKLAELLRARPGLRLNLCGIASVKDQPGYKEPTKKSKKDQTKEKPPEIPPELQDMLEQLAQDRSGAVKRHLVDNYSIKPERLFECRPILLLSPVATPSVEFKF